jgi:hypothetical protein
MKRVHHLNLRGEDGDAGDTDSPSRIIQLFWNNVTDGKREGARSQINI